MIKHIDIAEFREFGYLQEVNRLFFHPLGLALEITVEEDGTERVSGIWDCRDDPEGVYFAAINPNLVANVENEKAKRIADRVHALGFFVQMPDDIHAAALMSLTTDE